MRNELLNVPVYFNPYSNSGAASGLQTREVPSGNCKRKEKQFNLDQNPAEYKV